MGNSEAKTIAQGTGGVSAYLLRVAIFKSDGADGKNFVLPHIMPLSGQERLQSGLRERRD